MPPPVQGGITAWPVRARAQSGCRVTLREADFVAYSVAVTSPWGGPRAVAAALGVVGPTTWAGQFRGASFLVLLRRKTLAKLNCD